jgi:hypothetical protein
MSEERLVKASRKDENHLTTVYVENRPELVGLMISDKPIKLYVDVANLIDSRLNEFGIKLTDEQDDKIHDVLFGILEDVSTGYYRHHM